MTRSAHDAVPGGDGWSGPPRFHPPVEPITDADGNRRFHGISYALVPGYRPLQLDLRAHADTIGLDVGRVGVWGESAGGHLAALVALTALRPDLEGDEGVVGPSCAVDAVVDWYGVADPDALPRLESPAEIAAMLPALDHPSDVLLAGVDAATHDDAAPLRLRDDLAVPTSLAGRRLVS